jgi:hypothetical protein
MKIPRVLLSCLVGISLLTASLFAQGGGPGLGGSPAGADPVFLKLFSGIKGFSANVSISVVEKGKSMPTSFVSTYEFGGGNLRVDIDLTQMKSPDMPVGATAQLESMGMGKMTTIMNSAKGTSLMMYPGLKAYVEMKTPSIKQGDTQADQSKLKSTEIGQETVDGHPCVKSKVTVQEAGKTQDITIWTAKDMDNFPIKLVVVEGGSVVTLLFSQVKLAVPAASRFEVPAGYTAYPGMQQLMQTEMMKKMSGSSDLPGIE